MNIQKKPIEQSNINIAELIGGNPQINFTLSGNDLIEFAEKLAKETAENVINNHEEKVYSRNEILEKFDITGATLWRWQNSGVIKSKKIGGRIYYSESEVKKVMELKG